LDGPSENTAARRKIRRPPDFTAAPRNLQRAVEKFGEPFLFTAGRRNFGQAVEKSGSAPEN
jgi:hypothetical protein